MSSYLSSTNYCSCFEAVVPECTELLYLQTNEYDTPLVVEFLDKFGQYYQQEVLTDGIGTIELDLTLFPEGMFNSFAGEFILQSYVVGSSNKNPIYFPTDLGNFPCLNITFKRVYTTNTTSTSYYLEGIHYQCCCEDVPLSCN